MTTSFWIIVVTLAFIAPLFVALPLLRNPKVPGWAGSGTNPTLSIYRHHLTELDAERRAGRLAEDQYVLAREELENRLLEEVPDAATAAAAPAQRRHRAAAVAAALAIPFFAGLLYLALGNPAAFGPEQRESAHGLGQQQMDALVERLAARLEKNPQDARGWIMLARAQTVLGRFDQASSAYAKSLEIFPDDPQLLADYADALAMARGGRLQGEPEKLIERALRADPNNAKALALAGTAAFDNQDFSLAIEQWERLRGAIPRDSEFAKSIQASIDEARRLSLEDGGTRVSSADATKSR